MDKQLFDNFKRIATKHGIREIADMCWHEQKERHKIYGNLFRGICTCGKITEAFYPEETLCPNPAYTIPDIVAILKTLGLWEEFVVNVSYNLNKANARSDYWLKGIWIDSCIAEILTDPALLKQAVISFTAGVE